MTVLHHVIYYVIWAEIVLVGLFLAGCAVGVMLWGYLKWSERKR